ncbi:23S rRNA (pseudouridine(1915)-N(3))-methyltransferase RlmH [Rhodobacteraceae bacterium XHP0102]|nr:23S rRNA (pseudouridine(1915)-N(3))-methyltransferase RlmH [Rhodobacteraceae bacterium XHP0102]
MRVSICCVGRLRQGPEHELVTDYLTRFDRTGRALGLSLGDVIEVEDKKNLGMRAEADLLRRAVPKSAILWALDERGAAVTSPEFAAALAELRDQGTGDLALIIGGADGIDPSLRADAVKHISLGRMVWPHMLVRVMLSEQLYRAASILAGAPYHRS